MNLKNFGTQSADAMHDVAQLGFQAMITGGTIGVVFKALQEAFQALQDHGIVSAQRLAARDEITSVLGLDHVYELEQTYGMMDATTRRD
jgi:hypothetical protein